ncbi:Uncharacterized protein CLAVI_000210 [Candidatus Clavichlamydia salmonicola]|uniref:MotA/TolQ/ExbB proton channel family protein n=1 Tax=Candidatus Clavichlamydia salmonicola TaxID=469812 RepID=UPI00189192E3|nr:MotA/TolQ/ExbB proton channel family protein [Candidatus Clavichlamydia salmonicola]MBF5050599.1 Uncharacterized protein [Candidatus Clavichlamydia salmonicola]
MLFLLSNPLFHAYKQSDIFGKGIFLSLIFLSVAVWTVLWHKKVLFSSVLKDGLHLKELLKKNKLSPFSFELRSSTPYPFTTLFKAVKSSSLEHFNKNRKNSSFNSDKNEDVMILYPHDIESLETIIISKLPSSKRFLDTHLVFLSTTVSLAPFLGLLGTVWGILMAFDAFRITGNSSSVVDGLATALGTTVLGLIVAVPALIGHNIIKDQALAIMIDLEHFGMLLLNTLEIQYGKHDR